MSNWITIITFTYPHEAHVVMNMLEANEIDVILKDELTTQVDNFLSNAIGGVKIQVQESQSEQAISLLKENEYLVNTTQKNNKTIESINNSTKSLPLIGKLPFELRIISIISIVVILAGIITLIEYM